MLFWSLLSLSVGLAEPKSVSDTESIDVSLLYTGKRFGVSTERYNFPSLQNLKKVFSSEKISIRSAHHVMIQGDWILYSEDKTVTGALDFLAGQNISCARGNEIFGWQEEYETMISTQKELERLQAELGVPRSYYHWTCENEFGKKIELLSPDENAEMSWRWEDFEFRPSVHVLEDGEEKITLIGRSRQELSRTVARIAKEKHWYPETIYVDAGSFVGGSTSVKPNGLSLHRPLEYDILQDLRPTALGVGENELILGMNNFLQEIKDKDLPYVATNLKVDEKEIFPRSIQTKIDWNEREISIAFLSILDPKWMNQLPILASEKVVIGDPVKAINEEINALMASEDRPEVVVLLTTASSETMTDIRIWSHGIDVMLGDSTMATFRVQNRNVEFFEYEWEKKGAPVTLPMDGLSSLKLTVGDALRAVEHKTIFVREDFSIEPKISTVMTQNRMQYYGIQEHLLLEPTGKGWDQKISQEEWENIVCQLMLEKTGADTVFLRGLPKISKLPGVRTKKQVADSLAIMDVVEVHRISGASYPKFLLQTDNIAPITCGAKPGQKTPKVRGRPIDEAQSYFVATTDQTRLSSELKMLIPTHQSQKVLDKSGAEIQKMKSGEYLSLRELVVSGLEAEGGVASVEKLEARMDSPIDQQVIFRVRKASLLTEGLRAPEDERYESVPESMLNNQTSSTRGWAGDIALEYYSSKVQSDLRYRASFSELSIEEDTQEVSDDWILSSAHTLPGIKLQTGAISWSPYSEVMFDSEFSPQELDDGTEQSKQSDLSLTIGLSSLSWRLIKNMKLGVLANRDLAQFDEKPTEYGGKVEWTTQKAFSSYLIWTTNGTLQVYADTPDDDASDLRWRLGANNKFSLPLSQYFGISIYNDILGVQGRTDVNNEPVFAWTMGVSMDVLGAFALMEQ